MSPSRILGTRANAPGWLRALPTSTIAPSTRHLGRKTSHSEPIPMMVETAACLNQGANVKPRSVLRTKRGNDFMKAIETIQDRIKAKAAREADRLLNEMHSRWDSELCAIASYPSELHVKAYDSKEGKPCLVRMDTLTRSLKDSLRDIVAAKLENKYSEEFCAKVSALRADFAEMQEYIQEEQPQP